jgi:anaerobic magnesium-protoporphyrin IX monomethyl ester cyclase
MEKEVNAQLTKKTNIILVNPNYKDDNSEFCSLPVGLGYIAKSIQIINKEYEIVDLNVDSIEYLFELIKSLNPEFLGISLMSYKCQNNYKLLTNIKVKFPNLTIIAGGPHITANMDVVLKECTAIDVGVVGEGEYPIQELLLGNSLDQIKGILFRRNSQIIFTGPRNFIPDLDKIPYPTYEKFKLKHYGNSMVLNSSRGCPYHCIFCGGPRILGSKWRKRSSVSMFEELYYWYLRGYRNFYYSDSNFGFNKSRIVDFCDKILDKKIDIQINADGLRADHFNKVLLQKMWDAGFKNLTFGVESGSDKVLLKLKKGESIEKIEETIKNAVNIGFNVALFFIIGSPTENIDDIKKSFDLTKRYNIAKVYFFNLTPVPGTEYYNWVVENGLLDEKFLKYPEEKFGFLDYALLPNDILTREQITHWIKKSRHLERQIHRRYQIQQLWYIITKEKFKPYQGQFSLLSWFVTLPTVEKMIILFYKTWIKL